MRNKTTSAVEQWNQATSFLEILDNTMEAEGLMAGDFLGLKEANGKWDGKLVVGRYNGQTFIKRCQADGTMIRLAQKEGTAEVLNLPIEEVEITHIVLARIRTC